MVCTVMQLEKLPSMWCTDSLNVKYCSSTDKIAMVIEEDANELVSYSILRPEVKTRRSVLTKVRPRVPLNARLSGSRDRLARWSPKSAMDGSRHHKTPASPRSFSINSSTLLTTLPPLRAGGSVTWRICSLGRASTPVSSSLRTSIGFFFAFMMLGSVA